MRRSSPAAYLYIFAILLACSAPVGFAQTRPSFRNGPATRPGAGGNERRGEFLERLRSALQGLDLNQSQQEQVRQLMADLRDKGQALRQESGGDKAAMRDKGMALLQEFRTKLQAILTPEQQEKLKETLGEPASPASQPSAHNDVTDAPSAPASSQSSADGPTLLAVGQAAPAFNLKKSDGPGTSLDAYKGKMLLLVFGSYSSPSFRDHAAALEKLRRDYGNRLSALIIYTRESHAVGEWDVDRNRDANISVQQPSDLAARTNLARQTQTTLKLGTPMAVDSMDDSCARAYGVASDAAYLIGRDGTILAREKWFDPYGMRRVIDSVLDENKQPT